MSQPIQPKLSLWPFVIGDAILLALIGLLLRQSAKPLDHQTMWVFVGLCGLGAFILIIPAMLEYRTIVRLVETSALTSAVDQIGNLEQLMAQISMATSQWQGVQEHSGKSIAAAREIGDRMAAETTSFVQFMQKANDGEKAQLRLEVEKLKRGETEWLKVVVPILDHVYALNQAALRSGQRGVIEQVGNFQTSCRDLARRVGLAPLVPAANDPWDPQVHQLPDPNAQAEPGARVGEIVATGFTFRGQLLRPALIRLQEPVLPPVESGSPAEVDGRAVGALS